MSAFGIGHFQTCAAFPFCIFFLMYIYIYIYIYIYFRGDIMFIVYLGDSFTAFYIYVLIGRLDW